MLMLLTFAIGSLGGLCAFLLGLPIPWLVGSLLAVICFRKVKFVRFPPTIFSKWMRVMLGVALGASVADSLQNFNSSYVALFLVVITFVLIVSLVGYFYFKRLKTFTRVDSFMSSLPGGFTFMMSLSDDLGDRFPRIALIHTIRMIFVILCFSFFAFILDMGDSEKGLASAFAASSDPMLWQVLAFAFAIGSFATRLSIPGGHIMFPMIASMIFYSQGWLLIPVPELFTTVAMITFGINMGASLSQISLREFKPYVTSSLIFSVFAMSMAILIAVVLGEALDMHYFLLFLALAPGSIAEISLIALALGFDVGLVAMVHTCRYLLIMFVGVTGLNYLKRKEKSEEQPEITSLEQAEATAEQGTGEAGELAT